MAIPVGAPVRLQEGRQPKVGVLIGRTRKTNRPLVFFRGWRGGHTNFASSEEGTRERFMALNQEGTCYYVDECFLTMLDNEE